MGLTTATGCTAARPEAIGNVAYEYIRGRVRCEQDWAALLDRPATFVRAGYGVPMAVPADGKERFVQTHDQKFRA